MEPAIDDTPAWSKPCAGFVRTTPTQLKHNPLYGKCSVQELCNFIKARTGKDPARRRGKKYLRRFLCKLDHEQTFSLLALTPELRLAVYEQILRPKVNAQSSLVDGDILCWTMDQQSMRNTAIFRANKQISAESLHYWYQQKVFRVLFVSRYSAPYQNKSAFQTMYCSAETIKGMVFCSRDPENDFAPTAITHFQDLLMKGTMPDFGCLSKVRHLRIDLKLKAYGGQSEGLAPPPVEIWSDVNAMLFCFVTALRKSRNIQKLSIKICKDDHICTDEGLQRVMFPFALLSPTPAQIWLKCASQAQRDWFRELMCGWDLAPIMKEHHKLRVEGYELMQEINLLAKRLARYVLRSRGAAWVG